MEGRLVKIWGFHILTEKQLIKKILDARSLQRQLDSGIVSKVTHDAVMLKQAIRKLKKDK